MMRRYIAFLFSSTDALQLRNLEARVHRFQTSHHGWTYHQVSPGMCFLYRSEGLCESPVIILPKDRGMVFGRVFTRPSADHPIERDTLRDEKHVRAIVDSCGDLLLSERWGQYVAFLADDMHTR